MKVIFTQHGGQAAGVFLQRPPVVVDTAGLDEAKAAELKSLVSAATSAPPRAVSSNKARDQMSYNITIHDDNGRETALSQSDTTMSEAFGQLLGWLQRHPQ